jgi:hypothetical protein
MALFDKPTKFTRDGSECELVPLAGGRTVEVCGFATFYSREWMDVVWTDDRSQRLGCSVPAADVPRPAEGEWHGHYVQF